MVSSLCLLRYTRCLGYNEGLNNWYLVLRLSYGLIYILPVPNDVCSDVLPICHDKILIPHSITQNSLQQTLLPHNPSFHARTPPDLKNERQKRGPWPFSFLGGWLLEVWLPVSSEHEHQHLCPDARQLARSVRATVAICASRHMPVT